MSEVVESAKRFATVRHRRIDQRRKYTFQPYEQHLRAVTRLLEEYGADDHMIAAAWLHDVVEDTPATFEEVEVEFGADIARLVMELTDVSRLHHGNRATRKALDREHLAQASDRAQFVKLADLVDNCQDICRHDARFGRLFVEEMGALLDVIRDRDSKLYKRARKTHATWAARLQKPGGRDSAVESEWKPLFPPETRSMMRQSLSFIMQNFRAQDIARPVGSARPESEYQVVSATAPITLVVSELNYFDVCYVRTDSRITHQISREDFNSPIARMWLFGMVIVYEKAITELIRLRWGDDGWQSHLSEGRRTQALALKAERERRGERPELIDCLQFSDKVDVIATQPEVQAILGFRTRSGMKRVNKEMGALRDALAHSQDLQLSNWPQIVRLCERTVEILTQAAAEASGATRPEPSD